MHRSLIPFTLSIYLGACALAPATAQNVTDPAPPKVQTLTEVPLPPATAQPGLKFYRAPKPLAKTAVVTDWRDFLGSSHNAVSPEAPLLTDVSKGKPTLVWEVVKGEGYATPAVIGERVVLFHREGSNEVIECLQAETGKRYWKTTYPTTYEDRYGFSGGPRCQPVSDGDYVYTLGAEGKLHCLKLTTGQILWKRDIVKEFALKQNFFGVGATPLLEGDVLIVNVGAEKVCVAGFHKRTGKMLWGAGDEWGASYASPIPATVQGKRRVFVFAGGESQPTSGGLLCIDPTNGKIDFRHSWRARRYESVNASSPIVVGNQVYISECYGPGGVLLDILPDGTAKEVWSNRVLNTHFMTAIHKDGYLYGIDGHGPRNAPFVCIELKTGKEMWRIEPEWEETLKTAEGERKLSLSPGLASFLLVGGRCLILGNYGQLAWVDLNPKAYTELSRTSLFIAAETWSMPALSKGLLYVVQNSKGADNTSTRLLCYDLRGEAK